MARRFWREMKVHTNCLLLSRGRGDAETLTYLCVISPGALQKIKEKVRKQKEMLSRTEESRKDDLGSLPASKMNACEST